MIILVDYIKYYFIAKGKHGTHSPFVYDFIDKCLSIPIKKEDLDLLKQWNKNLLSDHREIEIKDYGAGSKKLGTRRKVSQIFKVSSSGKKYGALLYRITQHYQPKNILELGTSLGTGSLFLHLGNKNASITTVEGCPQTAQKAIEHLNKVVKTDKIESDSYQIINEKFENAIERLTKPQDLIFIDGNHQSEAVLKLLDLLHQHIHDETIIIIDDIRWNNDMRILWETLKEDQNYHLTMDLLRMGIIMKRHHQKKEHFVIRY